MICKKAQKGQQMHLMAVKETRKCPGFVIYSYLKDCAYTAVKRDARVKFLTGCVKEIPSFNRRCTKRIPFLSKMVYKRVSRWTDLRVEPPVYNSLDYPSPPRQVSQTNPINALLRESLCVGCRCLKNGSLPLLSFFV